jgi:glycosyltransferase involved in cell wall biosynthesis
VSRRVLLTVSGSIPPDLDVAIEAGRRPRADYRELARAFDANVLDYTEARRTSGRSGRALGRLAGDNVMLAWECFRRRKSYQVIFTDGEQVGLPLAAFMLAVRRRPRHVMIGHRLSPRKKALLHRLLRLRSRIDAVVVYAAAQRQFALDELGYSPDRVLLTSFMVDTNFWRPGHVAVATRPRPLVCAAGQELRDYPTLIDAVRGLDADVTIAAVSPWSKRADSSAGMDIPPNVDVRGFDLFELRQLYADASFVVVPLEETDFQAGITTILEAMAMGKAVVCTRTTGQTDAIVDGENGRYVPPGDADALRRTIEALLEDPAEAARLGAGGQRWVSEHADIEAYASRLASIVAGDVHRRADLGTESQSEIEPARNRD